MMLRDWPLLAGALDLRLVALALTVCAIASFSAVLFFQRARDAPRRARTIWVVAAGAASGCALWSTHLIGMLAAAPTASVVFDVRLTALYLIAAGALMTAALGYAALGPVRWRAVSSCGLLGALMGLLHVLGSGAVDYPGPWVLPLELLCVSVFLGLLFVWAAVSMAFQAQRLRQLLAATVILTLAIAVHEFTGVGSVAGGGSSAPLMQAVPVAHAALTIAAVTLAVIALCFASAFAANSISSGVYEFGRLLQLSRFRQQIIERSEEKVREQNMRLDAALNNMSQGLVMFDESERIIVCNDRYLQMYDLPAAEVRSGHCTLERLVRLRAARSNFHKDVDLFLARIRAGSKTGKGHMMINELADGRVMSVSNQPMANGGWVVTHEDITEQRRGERRIAYLAHHDVLTGLPNRAAFNEQLTRMLDWAIDAKAGFAVFYIDLDRFKEINDVFGHSVGDMLLSDVAQRLQGAAQNHFIARLGGDEFTLIVTESVDADDLAAIADRMVSAMTPEFTIDGHGFRISISVGIACYPQDGQDTTTLLGNADAALYRAKAEGRAAVRFFEAEMDMQLRERHALQHELSGAAERGELILHYQPQARVSGGITGFEALVRWQHPTRGMIPPGTFIPVAEESGLIVAMGEWILREACREAASWTRPLQIAVNLSPLQFLHGDPVRMVHQVLIDTGLAPDRLQIEITEGVLMADSARPMSMLRMLKALGVKVVMDDFGTGYSSLSYLQSFPFDKIKIDRAFIANVDRNHQSAAIVRAIISLGQSLGLPVLAEGVETPGQLAFLAAENCEEVQGFLLGRPAPIAQHRALVEGRADITVTPSAAPAPRRAQSA
jgi:diguanylate cyclase (GGDEF)-like protein